MVGVAVGIYLVLLSSGKLLKRQLGVSLGRVYQGFSATAGAYVAIIYLSPSLPGRTELGALARRCLARACSCVWLINTSGAGTSRGRRKAPGAEVCPRGHRPGLLLIIVVSAGGPIRVRQKRYSRPARGVGRGRHRTGALRCRIRSATSSPASRCSSGGLSRSATGSSWTASPCRRWRSTGVRHASSRTTRCSSTCPTSTSSGRSSSNYHGARRGPRHAAGDRAGIRPCAEPCEGRAAARHRVGGGGAGGAGAQRCSSRAIWRQAR